MDASYSLCNTVYERVLKTYCHCSVDCFGNHPCDNGHPCDMCFTKGFDSAYEAELLEARSNCVRFEVGKTYSVSNLYTYGTTTITITKREGNFVTYCEADGQETTVRVQYMWSYSETAQRECYVEAILAWEYAGVDEYGIPFGGEPYRAYWQA